MPKVGEGDKLTFRLESDEYDGDITEEEGNCSRQYRTPTMPHYRNYAGSDDALSTAR